MQSQEQHLGLKAWTVTQALKPYKDNKPHQPLQVPKQHRILKEIAVPQVMDLVPNVFSSVSNTLKILGGQIMFCCLY